MTVELSKKSKVEFYEAHNDAIVMTTLASGQEELAKLSKLLLRGNQEGHDAVSLYKSLVGRDTKAPKRLREANERAKVAIVKSGHEADKGLTPPPEEEERGPPLKAT